MFSLDQLTRMHKDAASKALEDRHKFDPIYDIVENYVRKNKLILGGNISIKMTIGHKKTQDDFSYEIYSDHAVRDAFKLANLIAEVTEAVYVRTEIYGKELTVKIQERPIVKIIGLPKNMKKIIQPELINNILYIPADYHLIQAYRSLYLPIPDDWEQWIEYEEELYGWLKKEYDTNEQRFIGGSVANPIRDTLKSKLLLYLATRDDIILIGPNACESFIDNLKYPSKTIDIIASTPVIKELQMWIKEITNMPTTIKSNNVQLLTDFRLTRTTVYINDSGKIPVLYAYNCLDYDVIPFNKNKFGCQIGNPFVIMRFLLLDAWSVKVIRGFGGIDEKYAKNRILEIYDMYFKIREQLKIDNTTIQSDVNNILGVFQTIPHYIGKYYSDRRAKREMIKQQDFVPDYLPVRFNMKHGFYQEIK